MTTAAQQMASVFREAKERIEDLERAFAEVNKLAELGAFTCCVDGASSEARAVAQVVAAFKNGVAEIQRRYAIPNVRIGAVKENGHGQVEGRGARPQGVGRDGQGQADGQGRTEGSVLRPVEAKG